MFKTLIMRKIEDVYHAVHDAVSVRSNKGQTSGKILAGATAIIGVIIIDAMLNRTFASSLMNTLKPLFVPVAAVAAIGILAMGRR